MDASLRPISSVTMAGSVSLGAGAPPRGAQPGPSSGSDGMKPSRSRMVRSASPISGSDLPRTSRRPARLVGEARPWVTSTNRRLPASAMGRGVVSCQKESPRASWGRSSSADDRRRRRRGSPGRRSRDGEQCGDRPALDDLEAVVDQAPFDVLGAAEVRFDPPSELHEPHDLRVCQRWLLLLRRLDRHFVRPASRQREDGELPGNSGLIVSAQWLGTTTFGHGSDEDGTACE
jgi:hypothetical protein